MTKSRRKSHLQPAIPARYDLLMDAALRQLTEICRRIARHDYREAEQLFDLTREDNGNPLVAELAESFGMMLVQVENREERLERLVKSLEESQGRINTVLHQTVVALARAVERRDPYTAGHQQRVGKLASDIGRELGLGADELEGLALGGALHDIGKVAIPSELLNKPGPLSELEFGLIKTHSEIGHEILKDVEFPWPIARITWEHHEKFNGSGYPRGLSGEDIHPLTRIVTVADVVEAMMSHRPYRPALGLELALYEIESRSGRLYDPSPANACLRLFREKKYQLA